MAALNMRLGHLSASVSDTEAEAAVLEQRRPTDATLAGCAIFRGAFAAELVTLLGPGRTDAREACSAVVAVASVSSFLRTRRDAARGPVVAYDAARLTNRAAALREERAWLHR